MIELKKYKFDALYKMSSGISSKKEQAGHGAPFVSFSDVFNNYFLPESLSNLMDTSEKEQTTYSVKKGDIFLTRTSETKDELGMSCVAAKDYPKATYSGFVKRLRPIVEGVAYDKYMAFYLRGALFRKTMDNNAVMTLRASLNEKIFSYLDLFLPSYDIQVKIGDFLYDTYQKIELNKKINTELEAMAKLIYDYWFVQFDFPNEDGKPYKSSGGRMVYNDILKREIPSSWDNGKLKEIANTGSGGTPLSRNKEYYKNGDIPWINSGELNSPFIINGVKFITKLGLKNSSAKIFSENTLLVAMYGATAGKISLLKIPACTNQAICGIMPNNSSFLFYLKFAIADLYKYLVNLSSGSARDNLSQDKLKNLDFILPSKKLLEKYNKTIEPMMDKITFNLKENRELTELRNWLLPMLMNGQVNVN